VRASATIIMSLWCVAAGRAQAPDSAAGAHLIVIGVDGLSVDGVVNAKAPHLRELMSRSAWTLAARGVMPTLSSPNWASVIDGAGPEQHGITSNGYLHKMVEIQPICRDAEGMFPTVFHVLRAERPESRIAIFHDWPGFANLVEKEAPSVMQHEHGAARTAEVAARYWKQNRPTLMFVHLDNVDHTGHTEGWATPAYYRAVTDADGYIGTILNMLAEESALDSTYVLVTSDHGGKGRNHGKNSLEEIQIPWLLSGPEVAPGEVKAAVYTFDTAATIAWILGLNPPECWIGRPVLSAFSPAATLARAERADGPGRNCSTQRALLTSAVPSAPSDTDRSHPDRHQ